MIAKQISSTHDSLFTILPPIIKDDPDMNYLEKMIYGLVIVGASTSGYCWYDNEFISSQTGFSEKMVVKTLYRMVDKKYIFVHRRIGTREIYPMNGHAPRDLRKKFLDVVRWCI